VLLLSPHDLRHMTPRASRTKQTKPIGLETRPENEDLIAGMKALLISINRRFALIHPEDSLEMAYAKCEEVESPEPRHRLRLN
jgi:hypothetical protein